MRGLSMRKPAGVGRIGALLCLFAVASCSVSSPAVGPASPGPDASTTSTDEATQTVAGRSRIPPDQLPAPGQCRVLLPDEPSGSFADPAGGRCSQLRETIPAGAWLVYRPTDDPKVIRVWGYGEDRQVLWQRIYDAVTGELIRHVAPLGS